MLEWRRHDGKRERDARRKEWRRSGGRVAGTSNLARVDVDDDRVLEASELRDREARSIIDSH